jgi:hypothetical protein
MDSRKLLTIRFGPVRMAAAWREAADPDAPPANRPVVRDRQRPRRINRRQAMSR